MTKFRVTDSQAEYDSAATLEIIRERHVSVAAYCREHEFNLRNFYSALRGVRGRTRKGSKAALIVKQLDEAGLLVRKA